MKKFITFVLAALVIFAMCSCQPTTENLDGKVEFTVSATQSASKAINATDPGTPDITHIQLAFMPLNQSSPVAEYLISGTTPIEKETAFFTGLSNGEVPADAWQDDLILWSSGDDDWNDDAHLYLSQGQWRIFARAVQKDTDGTLLNVLYEGDATAWVNLKNSSCTIKMTPKVSTEKGSLYIGFKNLDTEGAPIAKPITSVQYFEEASKQAITYEIIPILTTGTSTTGTLDYESDENGVVSYKKSSAIELSQGSYIVALHLKEDDVDKAGGSVTSAVVFKDKKTTIYGDVEAAAYIGTTADVEIEEYAFDLEIEETTANTVKVVIDATGKATYTATYKATVEKSDADAVITTYRWFVDGILDTTATGSDTFTATLEHGKHNIQCIVTGKSSSDKTADDVKSNLSNLVVTDSRSKLN